MTAIRDLSVLLASMQPVLNKGKFYFATVDGVSFLPLNKIYASIHENEGLSVIIDEQTAQDFALTDGFCAAWITLNVHSDLEAVGLTAIFAKALAEAGIGCNVVAGNYHDHIFVPYEQAQKAMKVLLVLQQTYSQFL